MEAQKAQQRIQEDTECPICMERDKDCVLNCGHRLCLRCADGMVACPFCSVPIKLRVHTFG